MTKIICPRCLKNELIPNMVFNSLSRRDNNTYICNPCGDEEGLLDAGLVRLTEKREERESRIKVPEYVRCVECNTELLDDDPELCVECGKPICVQCLRIPEGEEYSPNYCKSCYVKAGYKDVVGIKD